VAQAAVQDDATIVPEDVSQLVNVYPVVTGLGALHLGIAVHPENAQFPPAALQVATAVPWYPEAQPGEHEVASVLEQVPAA
jgi:hypothetical protein